MTSFPSFQDMITAAGGALAHLRTAQVGLTRSRVRATISTTPIA